MMFIQSFCILSTQFEYLLFSLFLIRQSSFNPFSYYDIHNLDLKLRLSNNLPSQLYLPSLR